ncbi:Pex12 amino terminal region-domain-containing protein [Radiomyces spectabilis]|uniref:Pex12 amino terminal region-domain-containing protein n=1 Tax=Radiomyces spectabilis TaxID=64574 RepID=UPI00221F9062|nr:Pex12 amino terminal region-domain-containing protein [Radiomyces spectabilis]KAI8385038.1 Pex12 amino terminal region-domain-containing protein [Radiomyces spectabilis]
MEFMSALGSQEDAYRPSLFELVAQEKLRELLQPAVQYLLAIYAQRYPRYLIRVVNNHEEFYAALMFFVERHYLKEWGASFAENFYGLKRVAAALGNKKSVKLPSSNAQSTPSLTKSEINKSLFMLVALPYIKCKLDLYYQKVSGGASSSLLGINEREERETEELNDPDTRPMRKLVIRFIRVFRKLYPIVNALYHGSNLAYNIAYLFGKTRFYTPWLHLIGIEVKRMSMADYRSYYDKTQASQQTATSSLFNSPLRAASGIFSKVIEFLKVLLPMSIFFFKFLEWWYSSEFARGGNTGSLGDEESANVIPPPEKIKPDPRGTKLPTTPNTCPICLSSPINNPTALPSGYVFCYTCAFRYVEDHGRCPVTWIKVSRGAEDLTKIYADGNV